MWTVYQPLTHMWICVCGTDCFSGIECCRCVLALTACFHAKYRTAPRPINRTLACWSVKDCQPCMPVLLTENLKESIHLLFYNVILLYSVHLSINLSSCSFLYSFYNITLLFHPYFHPSSIVLFLSFIHFYIFVISYSIILSIFVIIILLSLFVPFISYCSNYLSIFNPYFPVSFM